MRGGMGEDGWNHNGFTVYTLFTAVIFYAFLELQVKFWGVFIEEFSSIINTIVYGPAWSCMFLIRAP